MKYFLIVILLLTMDASAQTASPQDITCDPSAPLTYLLTYRKCEFPVGQPYGPPNFYQPYTVGFSVPEPVPYNNSAPLVLSQAGYGNWTGAPTAGDPNFGWITIKPVPDFYPTEAEHRLPNGIAPLGWGGWYFGLSNMYRDVASLEYVDANFPLARDREAGIKYAGTSYGASSAEIKAVLLWEVSPYWQSQITVVDSMLGPSMSALATNGLIQRRADSWMAWGTPTQAYVRTWQMDAADPFLHLDRLKYIYFNFKAASNDSSTYTNIPMLKKFCDSGIACRAVWGSQDHALPQRPLYDEWIKTFSSSEQSVRLDDLALIVFQNSSANDYGSVGNINANLRWNNSAQSESGNTLTESVGYQRTFGLFANEPNEAQVNVLIRLRKSQMKLVPGDWIEWSFRGVYGRTIAVKVGEVSVPVLIPSSAGYNALTIRKTGERVPGC